MTRFYIFLLLCRAFGCNIRPGATSESETSGASGDTIHYASGYTVTSCNGNTIIEVRDP